MHARSALFDVYGDHLRERGHQAPVAGLIRLLDPVGVAAPAVRTAISRMVSEDWLEPVALEGGRGYRATDRAIRRLDEAADRIYRQTDRTWDGSWQLVFVTPPHDRAARVRLRADLAFMGYAELTADVWVSPFPRRELSSVLAHSGGSARTAHADRFDPPPTEAWDLSTLRMAYDAWPAAALATVQRHERAHDDPDKAAFAARFYLVHEWRKFLFADPGLPDELLPRDWPGRSASEAFDREARRLKPAADRFVARCLDLDRADFTP
ncbi:MAG: PaaX family transcriptional regulator C-terminal domain-containing protein [Nocardioides sp.]